MNIKLPILLLLLLNTCFHARASPSPDKYTHTGVCYAIEYTPKDAKPFYEWKPWQCALFVTGVIGGAKERYDASHLQSHTVYWAIL